MFKPTLRTTVDSKRLMLLVQWLDSEKNRGRETSLRFARIVKINTNEGSNHLFDVVVEMESIGRSRELILELCDALGILD